MDFLKSPRGSLAAVIEAILLISGIISLISIDEDLIRWSGVAVWLIEFYRAVTYPIYDYIARLIRLDIPSYVRDLWTFAAVVLAGANVYSLRRHGRFAVWEALKMFVVEQVSYRDADIPESDIKYVGAAAWISVLLLMPAPFLLIWSYRQQGGAESALWWYLAWYVLIGFALITVLQDRIPAAGDDAARRKRATLWFRVVSIVFLPSAVYRYLAFMLFCFFIIVFGAWRLYLYMLLTFVLIFALNELNLRFVKQWDSRPVCLLMSIPETCDGRR